MFHPHGRWCWLGLLVLAALDTPRAQTHVHPGTHPPVPAAAVAPSGGTPNTDTTDPASRWRAANEAVGAFPRGHADILRWERAQGLVRAPAPGPSPDAVWTLDDVARHALRARPDLLIGPGLGARERWEREQAAALAVRDAQAAWIDAIAARQTRQLAEAALEAAAIGAELAQRMQHVGNFSAQRALVETLPTWEARQRLRQAQDAEQRALTRLWQRLGGSDSPATLAQRHLPLTLPAVPTLPPDATPAAWAAAVRERHPRWLSLHQEAQRRRQALPAGAWQALQTALDAAVTRGLPGAARLDPAAPRWPHGWVEAWEAALALAQLERQIDGDVQLALAAAQRSAEAAREQREQVLPAAQRLEDETLLRYNGMLASTWDLLAAVRARIAAQQATLDAERRAWLAWLDLQAVRAGVPLTDRAPEAAADATPTAAKGH